jgi:hypothetical protein
MGKQEILTRPFLDRLIVDGFGKSSSAALRFNPALSDKDPGLRAEGKMLCLRIKIPCEINLTG